MNKKYKDMLTLALLIALLGAAWAVASGHIGITVGAVSLICAGFYAANQNQAKDAPKMTFGFLAGDMWAYLCCVLIAKSPWNPDITVFTVLFVFAVAAVAIAGLLEKYFWLSGWLGGWAINMTVLNISGGTNMLALTIQTGVAMVVGVWYVGVFLNFLYQKLLSAEKAAEESR